MQMREEVESLGSSCQSAQSFSFKPVRPYHLSIKHRDIKAMKKDKGWTLSCHQLQACRKSKTP